MSRAFTLIEVLVVVALLGIASAYGVGALFAADSTSSKMHAVSILLDADARCRLIAQQQPGGAQLFIDEDRDGIALFDGNSLQVASHKLRGAYKVHFLAPVEHEPLDSIRFDASGRTADYLIHLNSDNSSIMYGINGETGWSQRMESGL